MKGVKIVTLASSKLGGKKKAWANLSSSSLKDWPKVKEEVDRRIQVTSQDSLPNLGLI